MSTYSTTEAFTRNIIHLFTKKSINNCKKYGAKPTLAESDFTAIKTLNDAINCSFLAVGHGFVIKALLDGAIEVIDGKVVDHCGLLD